MSLVQRVVVDRSTSSAASLLFTCCIVLGRPVKHIVCVCDYRLWNVGSSAHYGGGRGAATSADALDARR